MIERISTMAGIYSNEMEIGTEINDEGYVTRIVVFVSDDKYAKMIVATINKAGCASEIS